MFKFNKLSWVWIFIFISGLGYISYFASQSEFLVILLVYSLLFVTYIHFIRKREELTEKTTDLIALLFHAIPLFAVPTLSPDIYRFIWDGEILTQGIHPYSYTPADLLESSFFESSGYLNEVYSQITDLSKANYSPYPTINQFYFVLPAFITENIVHAVIFMKILVLGTGVIGYIYLKKILSILKVSVKYAWVIAINPFIIIELTGNLHFEGVMLSFLFVAFYFVLTKKWLKAAFFWAIAINVKLTPLILLPFLMRFIGWKSTLKVYSMIGIFTLLILSIYLWPTVFPNFIQSIELYFNNFQFNSSIFSITEYLLYPIYDYETILVIGPLLSKISVIAIFSLAFLKPIKNGKLWFDRMLWGYLIYLLFSTTVHPWYLVFPFGLSVLTRNTFMIGWTFLIVLSYGFYAIENQFISKSLIVLEYSGVATLIVLDLVYRRKHHILQKILKI